MIKKIFGLFIIFALFFVSRQYIWKYWPTNYSDVRTDYERYARMWNYGLVPYTHHLYEYPPVSIPILSLPLKFEHLGVNYYHNYRFEVLVVDIAFFVFFVFSVFKLLAKKPWWQSYLALAFYMVITTISKSFFYEGLDLMFMSSIFTSFLLIVWLDSRKLLPKVLIWFFFWLSTGIKFLTLPLMVPLFLVTFNHWKKDLFAFLVGFVLIWGIPIAIYGSTLIVPFEINGVRPMKYSSFPSYLVQMVDNFTKTETRSQNPPDFALFGPVAEKANAINNVAFPLSMLVWLVWSSFFLYKQKTRTKENASELFLPLLRVFGLYLYTLFFFAKIFSQPFHIWYMALVAVYPFLAKRVPLVLWLVTTLVVIQDTTTLFYLPSGVTFGVHNYLWGFTLKFLLMFIAYLYFIFEKQSATTTKSKPTKKVKLPAAQSQ